VPTTPWVAGLYSDLVAQPAPPQRVTPLIASEGEDRSVLRPPLPPVAENLYADLLSYRFCDVRAAQQFLLEEDARSTILPRVPSAFDDDGTCSAGRTLIAEASLHADDPWHAFFAIPLGPWGEPFDQADQQQRRDCYVRVAEEDSPFALPAIPFIPGDADAFRTWSAQGLLTLVPLDEFVGVPVSGAFGAASRGRSARLGFSFSAFR